MTALKQQADSLQQDVSALKQELAAAHQELSAAHQTIEIIASFLGVMIPAWQTQDEVENGDEMGTTRPSASTLGLAVQYVFDQANPAFSDKQVESIHPPAGTLVARGSTVTVTVNLEG